MSPRIPPEKKNYCREFLKDNYEKMTVREASAKLRMSPSSIIRLTVALGFKKRTERPAKVKGAPGKFFRFHDQFELFIGNRLV